MNPYVLADGWLQQLLSDDVPHGDLTSWVLDLGQQSGQMQFSARYAMVLCGSEEAWRLGEMQGLSAVGEVRPSGSRLQAGEPILTLAGPADALHRVWKTAQTLMEYLSGVATGTATIADAIAHTRTTVADTRKTIPGLRALQKYAVVCGGGSNHRFGLDDAVLIKDNHIAVAGGVRAAVEAARAHVGHLVKIEVEVDSLAMLAELLDVGADVVLLDNMGPHLLREAVAMVDGRMVTEASGRITPETAVPIAEAGVDLISVGWLTHSAKVLDVGLDHVA